MAELNGDGTHPESSDNGQKVKFTPVFKLLLFVVIMVTITSAVAGVGAWAAFNAADDAAKTVKEFEQQASPEATKERQRQINAIITDIEGRIDCNEYDRWVSVTSSIEKLLDLPAGSVEIKPCVRSTSERNPNSGTTTTTQP